MCCGHRGDSRSYRDVHRQAVTSGKMPKGQQIQHHHDLRGSDPLFNQQPRPIHAHQTPAPSQELSKKQHLKESIWPTWYHTSAFRSYWRQTLEIRCFLNHHNTGWHNWAVAASFSNMAISNPSLNLPMHRTDPCEDSLQKLWFIEAADVDSTNNDTRCVWFLWPQIF